jgi:hypothetical protein
MKPFTDKLPQAHGLARFFWRPACRIIVTPADSLGILSGLGNISKFTMKTATRTMTVATATAPD